MTKIIYKRKKKRSTKHHCNSTLQKKENMYILHTKVIWSQLNTENCNKNSPRWFFLETRKKTVLHIYIISLPGQFYNMIWNVYNDQTWTWNYSFEKTRAAYCNVVLKISFTDNIHVYSKIYPLFLFGEKKWKLKTIIHENNLFIGWYVKGSNQ
jgi:hypothetical protein